MKFLISTLTIALAGFAIAVPNDTYETAIELDSSLSEGQTEPVYNGDATVSEDDRVAQEGGATARQSGTSLPLPSTESSSSAQETRPPEANSAPSSTR